MIKLPNKEEIKIQQTLFPYFPKEISVKIFSQGVLTNATWGPLITASRVCRQWYELITQGTDRFHRSLLPNKQILNITYWKLIMIQAVCPKLNKSINDFKNLAPWISLKDIKYGMESEDFIALLSTSTIQKPSTLKLKVTTTEAKMLEDLFKRQEMLNVILGKLNTKPIVSKCIMTGILFIFCYSSLFVIACFFLGVIALGIRLFIELILMKPD